MLNTLEAQHRRTTFNGMSRAENFINILWITHHLLNS